MAQRHGCVVGIKDSTGDWANTSRLAEIEDFIVYPGSELPLLDALAAGAPRCVSATANVNASAIAAVIAHWMLGMTDEAADLHHAVLQLRTTIQPFGPIPAQKALLARMRDVRWSNLRAPLQPLEADAFNELLRQLDALGWSQGTWTPTITAAAISRFRRLARDGGATDNALNRTCLPPPRRIDFE